VRRNESHTATAILSPRKTQFLSHYTSPYDFLSALSLFFTPLFSTSSLHFTPPYITSSHHSLPYSTSSHLYSILLILPPSATHLITSHQLEPPPSSHLATSRHHTTPHHTTLQSTTYLTSLLLCSAFFANSTILCVSGFEDPSSARLE
jgi:hypothetical protein